MKTRLFFVPLVVVMTMTNLYASEPGIGIVPDFFTKGNFRFGIYNPLFFNSGAVKRDGNKTYNYTNFDFRASADYFFADGFGAGLMLKLSNEGDKYVDGEKDTYSDFLFGINLIYGTSLGGINLYAKPHIGFGSETNKYVANGNTNKYKYGVFRAGFEIGAPIPLDEDGHITLDPNIGFKYTKWSNKDMTTDIEKDSKLYLGARLSVNLGCDDFIPDCSNGFNDALDRFSGGRNVIETSSKLKLYNLTYKDEYDSGTGTQTDKDRENGINFSLAYKRAIFDQVLLGISFSFNTYKYNYLDDPNEIDKSNSVFIGPVLEVHPFTQPLLGNFFVEGSIGIGGSKYKYEEATGTTENKYSNFNYDLNVGFDYGLSDYLSLVARIGLESHATKNKETDIKSNNTDGYFSVGTRISF